MDNVPPLPPQPPHAPPPGQPPYPPPYLPPTGPYPGDPYQSPQRGWFARNWLWFVPTGCLGMLVVGAVFIVGIAAFVFSIIKASEPYKTALARAKASPRVTAAMGTPVEEAFYLTGQIHTSGSAGSANLAIPLSGPKAKGTLFVTGTESGGEWRYSTLRVHVDNSSENIDLLDRN